jgi:UDP-glucose 4-epimerase
MPIEVYGDGEQVSDCVYVTDVADVLVHMLHQPLADEPVEVGPENSFTVNEVASIVATTAGDTNPIEHLPMRPGEVPNSTVSADTSTLRGQGIEPDAFVTLYEGIASTVDWFRENEGTAWHRPA